MFLVVGLGNPGSEYEKNRHNAGFMMIDEISKKMNIQIDKNRFEGLFGKGNVNGEEVILLKPQTYMNLSGESVCKLVNFFKIPYNNVLIIYDDVDLDIGNIRIRKVGSAGTHNGMKSIVNNLKTENFPRIRIGIRNEEKIYNLADFVLHNFSSEELEKISNLSNNVYDAVVEAINGNIEKAMNIYN